MNAALVSILKRAITGLVLSVVLAGSAYGQFSLSDEYTLVGYERDALDNPIARMAERLNGGTLELVYEERHGYLKSLLAALDIDFSSQLLVFSPTSLQHRLISPETPRAVYFNEDTYIGFVQNSKIIEVTTIDEKKGVVFYLFNNEKGSDHLFERENQSCLVCHDSQGTMGGGVPMLMALSSVYSKTNVPLKTYSGIGNVVDSTPIRERWGGWYVTGRHGLQPHLGNLMVNSAEDLDSLNDFLIWNRETLEDIDRVDPSLYDSDTSDIVALMVLEHQVTVQNQITYVRFKAPAVLKRRGMIEATDAGSWDALPEEGREALKRMLDELVDLMFFTGAAHFEDRIRGSEAFGEWFQSRGPFDADGRSLREFDLKDSLFRFPLSYLVYTEDFDALPPYARDYVLRRIAEVLYPESGHESLPHLTDEDRSAIREILLDTKPAIVPYLQAAAAGNESWQ